MKSFAFKVDPLTGEDYYEIYLHGQHLAADPLLNKGSCFTREERRTLSLQGLLPHGISTLDEQMARAVESYRRKPDDLERYIFLLGLLNRNETLYYKVLGEHLDEMLPIVYTPTVGQACLLMSRIMRRARGLYIDPDNIANIDEILEAAPLPDVRLVVVTDGERILGLGDLGADGMGISIGKVNLYVAAGGLHPACCLPVCLDVGTNNDTRRNESLYMGYPHPRLEGQEYFDFVEKFVLGVKRNFPNALIQWEDFAKHKAFPLLDRYRHRVLSFNDDIQGTGATAGAAILTAMSIKGEKLTDQRFAIVGMGQAGVGTARSLSALLQQEGLSERDAHRLIFAVDMPGLLTDDMLQLEQEQRPFAQSRDVVSSWKLASGQRATLSDVVKNAKPTVLIGYTATAGLFDELLLRQMAQNTSRPVILAMSNPTSKSECTPETAVQATGGRALVATGSPFAPVRFDGREIATSQCNNLYIFPGIGLGALVGQAAQVPDSTFVMASRTLAATVTAEQKAKGMLLPAMRDIRHVAARVALAVAKKARDEGLGRQLDDERLEALVAKSQWNPHFYPYRPGVRVSR